MKVLVTGSNGQLGKTLKKIVGDNSDFIFTSRESLDITNKKNVLSIVREHAPDIIFHFAAKTRGEDCAKNPEEAHNINYVGTKNIVEACKKYNTTMVFISTNEVFKGDKNEPYHEEDEPAPISQVGKEKYKAEQFIKDTLTKYYIVRTMWLYSEYSNNFLQAILKLADSNKEISITYDEIGSPTYSEDVIRALLKLIKTKKYGIYHLVNSGAVSRYEFGKLALDLAGKTKVVIKKISLKDFKRLSPPPAYSALHNKKGIEMDISLPDWQDGLKRFIDTYITNYFNKN